MAPARVILVIVGLVLLSGCQQSTLLQEIPDAELQNSYWRVVTIYGEPAGPGTDGRELHLVFADTVRGFSGCNRFTGSYQLEETSLVIGPLAGTRMFCRDAMLLESKLLTALQASTSFEINGEVLKIKSEDGRTLVKSEVVYLP